MELYSRTAKKSIKMWGNSRDQGSGIRDSAFVVPFELFFGHSPLFFAPDGPRAMANDLRAVAPDPRAMADDPRAVANDPRAVAPDPRAMAPDPRAMADDPCAVADDLRAMANDLRAMKRAPGSGEWALFYVSK